MSEGKLFSAKVQKKTKSLNITMGSIGKEQKLTQL